MALYNIDLSHPFTHEEAIRILFGTPACPFGVYAIDEQCPPYALRKKYDDADCHRCINEYFKKEGEGK